MSRKKGWLDMSDHIWEYFQCAAVILADFTICALLAGIAPLIGGFGLVYAPWGWFFALAIQLFLGHIILHHGASWTVYLLAQGALTLAEVILACLMFGSAAYIPEFRMYFGSAAVLISIHTAFLAYRPPRANLIVGYVDAVIIIFAFYLYTEYAMGRSEPALWALCCVCVVSDLVVVEHLRTEAENGHRISGAGTLGRAVLIALLIFFLLITGLAVGKAAGQIRSLTDIILVAARKAGEIISIIFTGFAYVLAAIIMFFSRLFPNNSRMMTDQPSAAVEEEADIAFESTASFPPWLFPLIAGIIAAGIIIWMLYMLRNTRIKLGTAQIKHRRTVKKNYLLSSVLDRLRRAAAFLSFEWDCLRNRRTLQGLYIMAEHRGERIKVKKKDSESPGAYLRRLEGSLDKNTEASADAGPVLLILAGLLDDVFYGGRNVDLDREQYAGYARLIRTI